uniref:Uncharacterized protein n=1 Tax=Octopus bimaculoides TaxID=37653 RepID=A0A0L8HBR6_OCTBM
MLAFNMAIAGFSLQTKYANVSVLAGDVISLIGHTQEKLFSPRLGSFSVSILV